MILFEYDSSVRNDAPVLCGVDEAGRAVLENPSLDLANFAGLQALKEEHSGLRTLLSVGGWDYSRNFSLAASDPEHRQAFAQTAAGLIE